MTTQIFWRTLVSGFIATFAMSLIAFFQSGFGLPVIDVGHYLTESFNHVHDNDPYSIHWGYGAYYIMGLILSLIWVTFLQKRIPGNWAVQGIIYGVILSIAAGLVVSPLVSLSAGESFGIFYIDTWFPGLILLAGLIMHISYGLILTLILKVAGVDGMNELTGDVRANA